MPKASHLLVLLLQSALLPQALLHEASPASALNRARACSGEPRCCRAGSSMSRPHPLQCISFLPRMPWTAEALMAAAVVKLVMASILAYARVGRHPRLQSRVMAASSSRCLAAPLARLPLRPPASSVHAVVVDPAGPTALPHPAGAPPARRSFLACAAALHRARGRCTPDAATRSPVDPSLHAWDDPAGPACSSPLAHLHPLHRPAQWPSEFRKRSECEGSFDYVSFVYITDRLLHGLDLLLSGISVAGTGNAMI